MLEPKVYKKSLLEIIEERKRLQKDNTMQAALAYEETQPTKKIVELMPKATLIQTIESKPIQTGRLTIAQIIASKQAAKNKTEIVKDSIQTKIDFYTRPPAIVVDDVIVEPKSEFSEGSAETFSLDIVLNEKQILARDMALGGKSFALTGAAGTGKTTALREIAKALLQSSSIGEHDFRIQGGEGRRMVAPSIAFVAWTRIASGNIRRAVHKDPELEKVLTCNITTVHNLLEFQPEYFFDEVKNQESMRFTPQRTKYNPLTLTHLVIEESTLIDLPLWDKLYEALPNNVQIIFVGDINQLPPVFGASIFNYALTQLPTIELTHVYRQAGDSTVLENAHRILEGKELIEADDFKIVRCGTAEVGQEKLSRSLGETFPKWQDAGLYDPETDIILSPWNKHELGTDNINRYIAQKLGTERGACVHQVIAGRTVHYLAAGDKVLFNKQVAVINRITHNALYMGREPMTASTTLNRFGGYIGVGSGSDDDFATEGYNTLDIDLALDKDIDVVKQSSHHVDITTEDGIEYTLETIGDFSPSSFSLGYALTVHKAQGCEWRRVFLVMHKAHSINLSREFIYTAVTRARESCTIIAKEYLINKTIKNQRLKGQTLADKIQYFNTGLLNQDNISCTK